MAQRLKPAIGAQITSDWPLFIETGRLTGLKPMSLYTAVRNNGRTINQYHVLNGIAKLLNKTVEDIVEPVSSNHKAKVTK